MSNITGISDPTIRALDGGLRGLTARQRTIASNIANIDTPGFKPTSVDFESALAANWAQEQEAPGAGAASTDASAGMLRTDPRHFAIADPAAAGASVNAASANARNDGNVVDLETEMSALMETGIRYGSLSRMLQGKFGQLRDVISGGR
jgi:flagellar basal-body rod protein FlgB